MLLTGAKSAVVRPDAVATFRVSAGARAGRERDNEGDSPLIAGIHGATADSGCRVAHLVAWRVVLDEKRVALYLAP
jgi:hypothetical protein